MKPEVRLLGFDDGPFSFEDANTSLAGVMARGGGYVEAVLLGEVTVDGTDATDRVLGLLEGSGFAETAQAVAFNGGAFGGFNVLDLEVLHEALGLPVVALIRDEPDDQAVAAALEKHFPDADERLSRLNAQPLEPVELDGRPSYVRRVGGDLEGIQRLFQLHTLRGRTPEPLRIAHLVATAAVEGRSRGA